MNMIELAMTDIEIGAIGTIYFNNGNSGHAGRVVEYDADACVIVHDGYTTTIANPVGMVTAERQNLQAAAERKGWDDFENATERCFETDLADLDMAYRLGRSNAVRYGNRNAQQRSDYPDSPIAPSWFDPSAAGETWDDGE